MIIDTTKTKIERQTCERKHWNDLLCQPFELAEHKTLFTFTGQQVNKQNQFINEINRLHKMGCEIVEFKTSYSGDINWLPRKIWSKQFRKPKWTTDDSLSWRKIDIRCVVVNIVDYLLKVCNVMDKLTPYKIDRSTGEKR